jgi:CubicO group peptidase (beta-lactamase class C family)
MKNLVTILFAIFLFLKGYNQKPGATDMRLKGIETDLDKVLTSSKAPSFVVAVVEKNKVIYLKGFGYRDLEKKLPADSNTLYAIGSCTKAFTAALLGQLQKEGKLDIDKPVRSFMPELKFFNDDLNDHVTARDMMTHRTGLPRHDMSWYLFPSANRDSLLQRIAFQQPSNGLREKWQYNNFMFMAQGKLAEKLTGQSWEDNIRERIFAPLGMKSSNMPYEAVKNDNNLAVGYSLKKDSSYQLLPHYNIGGMGPAGAIYSNVADMANWVITWINGGNFRGREIIPSNFAKDAIGSQMVVSSSVPGMEKPDMMFTNYGFGWFVSSYKSHYLVEHGGNIDGFSANVSFYPTDSIGIIVLTNQNGSWVPSVARNIIADRMLHFSKVDWVGEQLKAISKGKKAEEEGKKNISPGMRKKAGPTHDLSAFEGLFYNPGYGTMEITRKGDSLFSLSTNKKIWLENYHYDVFVPYILSEGEKIDTSERPGTRILFNTDASGEIGSFKIDGIEDPKIDLVFKRTIKPKTMNSLQLEEYTGNYELAGTQMKFFLKGETLFVNVPGQPDYELVALPDKDKFTFKALSGYFIQFERNDKNEITATSFIQPNGTFKATKKQK